MEKFDANTAAYVTTVFNEDIDDVDPAEARDFLNFIEEVYDEE